MNPRDIMTDAIHNFHPQYQQYTQYSSTASTKVIPPVPEPVPVPVPVPVLIDNSRQICLQHNYHGQLASIISGKAQMSQILTHNCWYTREVTRVNIAYLNYCLFWLLLLIIAYMYNIHQGGHKRNGSYEGVDSNEPQPALVNILMRMMMMMMRRVVVKIRMMKIVTNAAD